MTSEESVRHCPSCVTEYVAGIAACVDCGGPLSPGPMPVGRRPTRSATPTASAGSPAAVISTAVPDTLLLTARGADVHVVETALRLEGITYRVVCEGQSVVRTPDSQAGPFAVTLPVELYVAAAQIDDARAILASLQSNDPIGDQWGEDAGADEGEGADSADTDTADIDEMAASPGAAAPEGTGWRLLMLAGIGVAALLFFLR